MWQLSEDELFQTRIFSRLASLTKSGRHIAEMRYRQVFAHSNKGGTYYGVFDSFRDAQSAASSARVTGYDNEDAAAMYRDRLDRVFPADYPVLFWLERILPKLSLVFDLGGHVGIARHAYDRYLNFTRRLSWRVYDLPAVVAAGRELAQQTGIVGLEFTTSMADGSGSDLLFSSGALQYIEDDLPSILQQMERLPGRILLNQLPLSDAATYFTLQHIGPAVCPYAIRNRDALIGGLKGLGYELKDRWQNADKSCHIPLHEERSLNCYEGMFLELVDQCTSGKRA